VSGHGDVILSVIVLIVVVMVLAWLGSLIRRRDDIGIVWALVVVAVSWTARGVGDGDRGRRDLLTAMVTIWGVRRVVHLWRRGRAREPGSDDIASPLPADGGPVGRSLLTVFAPVGLFTLIATLPVQVAATPRTPTIGWLAVAGVALWGVGFFLETVGDAQLVRFRATPNRHSVEPDLGLWHLIPDPPRLGEMCVWWGVFVVAAETADARVTVVAPILMTIVLTRRSSLSPRRPLP
jgi:steroid 5-alpha reductase family enzyme